VLPLPEGDILAWQSRGTLLLGYHRTTLTGVGGDVIVLIGGTKEETVSGLRGW